jgi:sensor histidine kinase YesM
MENTRKRLKDMCDADMIITSKVGEGTTVRVVIPKVRRSEDENTVS